MVAAPWPPPHHFTSEVRERATKATKRGIFKFKADVDDYSSVLPSARFYVWVVFSRMRQGTISEIPLESTLDKL